MKNLVKQSFSDAGIEINGQGPIDIQVHDDRFYSKVALGGSLGLGESYMEGWWDCENLDQCIYHIMKADLQSKVKFTLPNILLVVKSFFYNLQTKSRSSIVGKKHYDIGNNLFVKMLDDTMTYSCAYWRNADNLYDAQIAKWKLICDKIGLKPGMKVLDIGAGWGAFAHFAAKNYRAEVTGITISQKQLHLAQERCKGLPVTLKYQDWREADGAFDRIVSVGQIEHVGYKNYRHYMQLCHRCLNDHGLFLLHTIGNHQSVTSGDPWISKYIFPNGMIPSTSQLTYAADGLFVLEDTHNFGVYYDNTLMAWYHNFAKNWDSLKKDYKERFFRMWKFYLLSCAAAFRCQKLHLWQFVFSKNGISGEYRAFR